MIANYNTENIRRLLKSGFTYEELHNDLCFDQAEFRSVLEQIPDPTSINVIVQAILEHAERWNLTRNLLEWAKKNNRAQYDNHQPYDLMQIEEIVKSWRATSKRLGDFFNLKGDKREIAIYLSRHFAEACLPTLEGEITPDDESNQLKDAFDVVSAVEMLEAVWLKSEIERPTHWLPDEVQEELKEVKITVNLEVCPEKDDIDKISNKGTVIFIGGPRANLGTVYYLFKKEAGLVRPTRWRQHIDECKQKTKEVIECIGDSKKYYRCPKENFNLGIIQRYKVGDQTIIYLVGTGVSGTGATVAYLRKNWLDLLLELRKKEEENFYKVIEVPRRKAKDLTSYGPDYWADKWKEVPFSCD